MIGRIKSYFRARAIRKQARFYLEMRKELPATLAAIRAVGRMKKAILRIPKSFNCRCDVLGFHEQWKKVKLEYTNGE